MTTIKYGSVCSGIEAASVAWHSLGWKAAWYSEIEPFPSKVLSYRFPDVPNLGDMTKLSNHKIYNDEPINLLVGGTPCQSFSIAGLRGGLDDERGNLALEFCRILISKQPQWFVWENVPGVFSSGGGKDLEAILIAFRECGYSCAWRVLDAQYYGVPQRRRRVFVVGHLGNDWRPSFAVLFESESLRRDFEKSAKERQETAKKTRADIDKTGQWWDGSSVASTLTKHNANGAQRMPDKDNFGAITQDWPSPLASTLDANYGKKWGLDNQHIDSGAKLFVRWDAFNFEMFSGECKQVSPCLQKDRAKDTIVYPINTMVCQGRPSDNGRMGFGIGVLKSPMFTLSKAHHHAVAYCLQGSMIGRKDTNGPQGDGVNEVPSFTLNTTDKHAVVHCVNTSQTNANGSNVTEGVAFKVNATDKYTVVYDTTQITSPTNRSNPTEQVCHTLAKGSHPPLLCQTIRMRGGKDGGGKGALVSDNVRLTLSRNNDQTLVSEQISNPNTCSVIACEQADTLTIGANQTIGRAGDICATDSIARRLTPLECERLQGFPDNWTNIPGAKDSPRYASIGNSMAVPVMHWIGSRIDKVDKILKSLK